MIDSAPSLGIGQVTPFVFDQVTPLVLDQVTPLVLDQVTPLVFDYATPLVFDLVATHYNYLVFVILVGIGLYGVTASPNLVKKVIGLNIFQAGIFLFFVTSGYVDGAAPPLLGQGSGPYASPLPHVLILTAIVVGVSLTAVALALVVRIYEAYGTLDEDAIEEVRTHD